MMPFAEEFTLTTRTLSDTPDADGNDVWETSTATVRGAFSPAGSTELVQGQATVITHDTLYLESGSVVPAAHDQMTVRGIPREVDGVSGDYLNPFTGSHPGPVVRLVEVTG